MARTIHEWKGRIGCGLDDWDTWVDTTLSWDNPDNDTHMTVETYLLVCGDEDHMAWAMNVIFDNVGESPPDWNHTVAQDGGRGTGEDLNNGDDRSVPLSFVRHYSTLPSNPLPFRLEVNRTKGGGLDLLYWMVIITTWTP